MQTEIPVDSPAIRALVDEIRQEEDPKKQTDLMVELAECIRRAHDRSDAQLNEDVHSTVDNFETARVAYRQAGLRLARVVLNYVAAAEDLQGKDDPTN